MWGEETILVNDPVEGATALWIASTLGCLDFVKELVSRGASIAHATDSKSSPLHGAASYGEDNVCKFLIECGASIDQPDESGQTPLIVAAAMQNRKCVELLIEEGANINHKDNFGNTALHANVSSELKSIEIVEILIKAGATNCANNLGYTPTILSSAAIANCNLVQFIKSAFHLNPKELYDYYCLNAAMSILECCTHTKRPEVAAQLWLLSACELNSQSKSRSSTQPTARRCYLRWSTGAN